MTNLIFGIILLAWGSWCIIAAIQKRKIQVQIFYSDELLPKKILGKYFDQLMNLFYGIICLAFGLFLILP